jgi:glycosyltransferase involved in cell wall biosynthesis
MKVSLVVPVYKKTFDQVNAALKTLQTQSHKDIEVIVVFDGPDADLETSIKSGFESDSRFRSTLLNTGVPQRRGITVFLRLLGTLWRSGMLIVTQSLKW